MVSNFKASTPGKPVCTLLVLRPCICNSAANGIRLNLLRRPQLVKILIKLRLQNRRAKGKKAKALDQGIALLFFR
jgi:hypothetical protein